MSKHLETITDNHIRRYLFAEMSEAEHDRFTEQMMLDDGLFFEVADAENAVVDAYVAGNLDADEAGRFERSLSQIPARRDKVANARALASYIEETRPIVAAPSDKVGIWQQLRAMLAMPSLSFGMGAAVVLLAVASGFLLVQNSRKNAELARLETSGGSQSRLESDLASARAREDELRSSLDAVRDESGDLQDELQREHDRRKAIEAELAKLKNAPTPAPAAPIVAFAALSPVGVRGKVGGPVTIQISPETKRVSLRLDLDGDVGPDDRLAVRVNQETVAKELAPRVADRAKTVSLTIPAVKLKSGDNKIEVISRGGSIVGIFNLSVTKP